MSAAVNQTSGTAASHCGLPTSMPLPPIASMGHSRWRLDKVSENHQTQKFVIDSNRSSWLLLSRGLPQGWIQEPVLLNVFIIELDKGMEFVRTSSIFSHVWSLAAGLGASSMPVQPRVTSGHWEGWLSNVLWRGYSHGQLLPPGAAFSCLSCTKDTDLWTGPLSLPTGSPTAVDQPGDRRVWAEPITTPAQLCSPCRCCGAGPSQ